MKGLHSHVNYFRETVISVPLLSISRGLYFQNCNIYIYIYFPIFRATLASSYIYIYIDNIILPQELIESMYSGS